MRRLKAIAGLFLACGVAAFGLGRCANQTGTDTGNPISLKLEFVGIPTPPAPASNPPPTLREARIVVKEIDLDPVATCNIPEPSVEPLTPEPEPGPDLLGPFVVDLLQNTTLPGTEPVTVPAGDYCEIDLTFDALSAEELPPGLSPEDPIVGNALWIQGSRSDGKIFTVLLKQDDRFKLEASAPQGIPIFGDRGTATFFISFDLQAWFAGVDLAQAEVAPNGNILIDGTSNAALHALIVENVIRSARLYRDLDGDGVLNPDEIDAGLVLAVGVDEEN